MEPVILEVTLPDGQIHYFGGDQQTTRDLVADLDPSISVREVDTFPDAAANGTG